MWITRIQHIEDNDECLNLLIGRLFACRSQISERRMNILFQIKTSIAAPFDAITLLQEVFVLLFHHCDLLLTEKIKTSDDITIGGAV